MYRKPEELENQAHVSSPLTATAPTELATPKDIERPNAVSPVPKQIKKQARIEATAGEQKIEAIKVEEDSARMEVDSNENCAKDLVSQQPQEDCNEKKLSLKQECDQNESSKGESDGQKHQMNCNVEIEEDTFEGISDIKYASQFYFLIILTKLASNETLIQFFL